MNVIYEPRGAAGEYSPLAANLYSGCAHGCVYCYAPSCLRRSREAFRRVGVRKGVLEALEKDARALEGDERPVLLSFTTDPYQERERSERVTRRGIEILAAHGMRIRTLTKNPALAMELDRDLLVRAGVEFGTTILFVDDAKRAQWEPNAPSVESRIEALKCAKGAGLRTWVSLEPVIDTDEALELIRRISLIVDTWKVGRWNHDARANAIDWAAFAVKALDILEASGVKYYIKDELWRSAGRAVEGREKQARG
jgi:DNA repair photolyase